jgi:hypothetical protein
MSRGRPHSAALLLREEDRPELQGAGRLNEVETWLGILTEQVIRPRNSESVRALVARIEGFTRERGEGATPFTWATTAHAILAKTVRKPQETSRAGRRA